MKHLVLMQVRHPPSNVSSKGQPAKGKKPVSHVCPAKHYRICLEFPPEAPVDGDVIIQQDVREAPFGAVLCDDAHVRDLDGAAYKFAQVGVVQLSVSNKTKDKHRRVCNREREPESVNRANIFLTEPL